MYKIKNINAGLVLFKNIKGYHYSIIGSYLDKNNNKIYTFPGGTYDKNYDKTGLHTAIREFIEEVFNIKIADTKLNEIVNGVKEQKLLYDIYIYKPNKFITFFGDFKILNFIYKSIYNHKINLYSFLPFRNKKIHEKIIPKDGLNEFLKIHLMKLEFLLKNTLKLRSISKYVLFKMIKLFNIPNIII